MTDKRQFISLAGLFFVVAVAAYMVVQLNAQASGDFTNAATAQIRDAQGRVVLQGQFMAVEEDDDDIERKATLMPTGVDADATGEAEVEFAEGGAEQEVEFSATNLQPGAPFTLVIDGTDITTATADERGNAEAEVTVALR